MPMYGYQCTECGHEFQTRQKMSDDPIKTCPECQGGVKRLLYPVGIVFKGTGWYVTDYDKTGRAEKERAERGETPAETPKTDSSKPETTKAEPEKAETKPEAAPVAKP